MVQIGHYENHARVGKVVIRSYDSNIPRPEKIPSMMAELESALTGQKISPDETFAEVHTRVANLVERIAKGFDYASKTAPDRSTPSAPGPSRTSPGPSAPPSSHNSSTSNPASPRLAS